VFSEPDSTPAQSPSPETFAATPAEAAPVAVPGAPPPPPHEAVEAAHQVSAGQSEKSVDSITGDTVAWSQEQPLVPPVESFPQAMRAAEESPAEEEAEVDAPFAEPLELIDETVSDEDLKFDWFILKVQVNREDTIKDALWRRVKMNGLERYFKEIVVPTEDVIEFTKTGKKRTVKRKLYPGYILINMAVSDESWFIVRETGGIGDFTGSAGKPTPMEPKDVERILRSSKVLPEEEGAEAKTAIPFKTGDRVRVKEGYFQNFEGDVHAIDQTHGRVTVMINIFGRATPVEIEHWQIEAV
jgi:transcription termination/antitermination protein NusG